MNIYHENTSDQEGIIKVQIDENDYREKVDQAIRDLQKKAQMPGFRQGKVPVDLIKKLHGKNVLMEQVNKLISEAVYNYIKDNELNILGNPIPVNEQNQSIDWDNQKEFEFHYSIGLAPDIDLKLSEEIEVDYYKITVDDKTINKQIEHLRRQYGTIINPDETGEEDIVFGELTQMADSETVAEEPLTHKPNIHISNIQDDDIKSQFLAKKIGEEIVFDLNKAFQSKAEAAKITGVEEDKLPPEGTLFRFTIETISRIEPAELNEEFFKKVATDKEISTEAELRDFVKDQISRQYQAEVDKHFKNEVTEKLIEEANIELPEEFIKQWLVESNKEELTREKVDAEFDSYADSLKRQFIENKISNDHDLKVTDEELKNHLREYVKMQLMQYGQQNLGEEMVENFVNNIMEKKEETDKVSQQIMDDKLIDLYKNTLKLNEKEVTFDEFVNLVQEKYNKNQNNNTEEV